MATATATVEVAMADAGVTVVQTPDSQSKETSMSCGSTSAPSESGDSCMLVEDEDESLPSTGQKTVTREESIDELRPAEKLSGKELIQALTAVYTSMISMAKPPTRLTCFHSIREPAIGIGTYLERIQAYFQCSDSCFVISLVYIDRIIQSHAAFAVSKLTIHRLLAASVVLAAKMFDDVFYSNAHYARVCMLSVKELNSLESVFLRLLRWKCNVPAVEFNGYHAQVAKANPVAADSA